MPRSRRGEDLLPPENVGLFQGREDLRRHGGGRGSVHGTVEQDPELVSPEPRHGVRLAQAAPDPPSDGGQDLVSHVVPVRVVHALETVQVEEEEGNAVPPRRAWRIDCWKRSWKSSRLRPR